MCQVYVTYYPKLPKQAEGCAYANFTGINNNGQQIKCGNITIYNWTGPPQMDPYIPPPCPYNPPPKPFTTPQIVGSLNKSAYTRSAYLDDKEKYKLYWSIDRTNMLIHGAVEVQTDGWVGLGISPAGMEGSDVFIGWVKDGKGHFADRFATMKALPPQDTFQDFYDIQMGQVADSSGLSHGAIAGIVISAFSVVALLFVGGFFWYRWKQNKGAVKYVAMDETGGYGTEVDEGVTPKS